MASAVYFLNSSGKKLLARNYRGDIPESYVDLFPELYPLHAEPCFNVNGINYVYIRTANIMVLAVAKRNVNVASLFVFLHHVVAALRHYVKDVQEESVRDNHVVLYEMLDEMMDFGVVQSTDINVLQDYVTQTPYQLQALSAVTGKIPWRPPGIFYKRNELFVDVLETVHMLLEPDGTPISSSVEGRIAVKSFLSGMPELRLGLNDMARSRLAAAVASGAHVSRYRLSQYVTLEDVAFHQAVSLGDFDADRTIKFIPPDGAFDLLTYRVAPTAPPPFTVTTDIDTRAHSRVLIACRVETNYKKRLACSFAEFVIPVPPDGDSPRFKASHGSVVYAPEQNAMIWRLTEFGGGRHATMEAQLQLPAVGQTVQPTGPVQVRFEVPALAFSGLEVRFLKVHEEQLKYSAYPWVRYVSKSGEYEVRRRRHGKEGDAAKGDASVPEAAENQNSSSRRSAQRERRGSDVLPAPPATPPPPISKT